MSTNVPWWVSDAFPYAFVWSSDALLGLNHAYNSAAIRLRVKRRSLRVFISVLSKLHCAASSKHFWLHCSWTLPSAEVNLLQRPSSSLICVPFDAASWLFGFMASFYFTAWSEDSWGSSCKLLLTLALIPEIPDWYKHLRVWKRWYVIWQLYVYIFIF